MSFFKPAQRKSIKIKVAVTGPSGSGKTYSSLLIAKGLGDRIALIDTEDGSASLYSDEFKFESGEISPPFTVDKYISAIKMAQDAKFDVLVIDSLSHSWAGEGGLLAQKESLDALGKGNSYTNWANITKLQEKLKSAILYADIHIIATMRSKQDYSQEIDEKGKKIIRKVGLAPIQRDGIEYEFTTVFDLGMSHECQVSKDRTGLFDGKIFKPDVSTGREIKEWLLKSPPVISNVNIQPSSVDEMPSFEEFDDQRQGAAAKLGTMIMPSGSRAGQMFCDIASEDGQHGWVYAKQAYETIQKVPKPAAALIAFVDYAKICGAPIGE